MFQSLYNTVHMLSKATRFLQLFLGNKYIRLLTIIRFNVKFDQKDSQKFKKRKMFVGIEIGKTITDPW